MTGNITKYFTIYVSMGCSRRPLECGRYYDYFEANGWEYTSSNADADFILVYTCGGFQKTEDQSLHTIERALKEKKDDATLVARLYQEIGQLKVERDFLDKALGR